MTDTAALDVLDGVLDRVLAGIEGQPIDPKYPETRAWSNGWRDAITAIRAELPALRSLVPTEPDAPEYVMPETISLARLADHIADVCGSGGDNWEGAARGLDFLLLGDGYAIQRVHFAVPDTGASTPRRDAFGSMAGSNLTVAMMPDTGASLDVERLARAIFHAERPDRHWPSWDEYIATFAHGATQQDVWLRKAQRVAAEYARLSEPVEP